MRRAAADVMEIAGFATVITGVYLLAGTGWALIGAGLLVVLVAALVVSP